MAQMVREEVRVTLFQDYMTAGIKILAEAYSAVHGGKLTLPSFIDMTHEKEVKQETAQEIIDHVMGLFA